MMNVTRLAFILPLVLCPAVLLAQSPPAVPAVTFNLDAAIVPPTHYSITVASDGSTKYESSDTQKKDADALDPYQLNFTMSATTLKRIFDLTEAANHFHSDIAFKGKTAHTGTKTLRYTDQNLDLKQTYEWSQNPSIQQLTTIFEGISLVQESARRLRFLRRRVNDTICSFLPGPNRRTRPYRLARPRPVMRLRQAERISSGLLAIGFQACRLLKLRTRRHPALRRP